MDQDPAFLKVMNPDPEVQIATYFPSRFLYHFTVYTIFNCG
jgi:hypothetical protein